MSRTGLLLQGGVRPTAALHHSNVLLPLYGDVTQNIKHFIGGNARRSRLCTTPNSGSRSRREIFVRMTVGQTVRGEMKQQQKPSVSTERIFY
jgi:hypothetical protein